MRYAFRALSLSALCLFLMPAFCLPAYAAENKEETVASGRASERASRTATRSARPTGTQAKAKSGRKTAPKPDANAAPQSAVKSAQQPEADHTVSNGRGRGGWVRVDSGSRQAYVGIHGGTAPLSLMCSTDGVLFAFTGQTGNDFMQVLRGGNASRAVVTGQPTQNGTESVLNPQAVPSTAGAPTSGQAPSLASDSRAFAEHHPAQADAKMPVVENSANRAPIAPQDGSVAVSGTPASPTPMPPTGLTSQTDGTGSTPQTAASGITPAPQAAAPGETAPAPAAQAASASGKTSGKSCAPAAADASRAAGSPATADATNAQTASEALPGASSTAQSAQGKTPQAPVVPSEPSVAAQAAGQQEKTALTASGPAVQAGSAASASQTAPASAPSGNVSAPASAPKAQPPANGTVLVFASGDLASNLTGAPEEYRPFGLTPPAVPPTPEIQQTPAAQKKAAPAPTPTKPAQPKKRLQLRSYLRVLSHSGSL